VRALSRRDLLKFAAVAAAGTAFGGGAYGYLYERRRVRTVSAAVPVAGLPTALAGLRIGLVSDLHLSPQVPASLIEEALGRLAAERCDLIAVAGDLVTWRDRRFVGPVAELVGALSAPLGVLAVLGNHDHDDLTPAALRARGVDVLKDTATRLTVRGESVFVGGLQYWTRTLRQVPSLGLLPSSGVRVLLAHDPRMLAPAAEAGYDVVLAGHTHGGQIVLPGIGAPAARRFPVVAGLARQRTTSLFVTRGVGTVILPIRLNCPPEVAVLSLEPAAPEEPPPGQARPLSPR